MFGNADKAPGAPTANMAGICLLLLVVLPVACEGRLNLTGSSTTAVAGQPFTFTCSSHMGLYIHVDWTVQLRNGTSSFSVRPLIDGECRYYFNPSDIYNFTCPRHDSFTMTILDVDYLTYQNSNWTCFERLLGERSNTVNIDVNVPLVEISINSTNLPMPVTENDDVTLVCETNPTRPLSTIIWTKGNQTLTKDVTSTSRDIDGAVVAVSMTTFTVSCGDHLTRIQCSGVYKTTRITSQSQTLFVHCVSKDETSGTTFGAGVGVGMTICLVPLLVAAAVYVLWWKRRLTMKDTTEPPESTDSAAPSQSDDVHDPNMYESIDDNTRERKDTAYEELHMQVYENSVKAHRLS